jgi:shikimate dehydrogenase
MTEILGVIGDPIDHSLSPLMHRAAIEKAGIDAVYRAFHIRLDQLPAFIEEVHKNHYLGFNVTIPHKQNIMSYLDDIAPEAQAIGAVNTVLHRSGQLIGYNTDAIGYLRSISEEKKWEPHGKSVTLLGAGGAARAVSYSLMKAGASQIYIIDQITTKANELAENINKLFMKSQRMDVIEWADLTECLTKSDLLVNATPIGLQGTSFDFLPLEALPDSALVSDLVYSPRETPLLLEAKKLGHKTHEGLGMLLYQGAEAFRIWFGKDPDVDVMRQVLTKLTAKN